MLEKFLKRTTFSSYDDFMQNFKVEIPANFNFAYDVVDEWARISPLKPALLWTDDKENEHQYSFSDIKDLSDRTASYFMSIGVKQGDRVLLILKRNAEFWFSIVALHKIGAIVIPATHQLSPHDIIYRIKAAGISMIVACGDEPVLSNIQEAVKVAPVERLVSIGPKVPEGFGDYQQGIRCAKTFVRPSFVNTNDDIMLLYFTSGTSGEPKMVAHDFTYPLAHILTARFWHNLHEESLHLTLADTGWGKAVWGKLYGQWIIGSNVFVYNFEKFKPSVILHLFDKYRITSFCAPPTVYKFLVRENVAKYDISSLQYCTIAGEALNPKIFYEWEKLSGLKVHEGFGQTETTLTIANYPWVEPKPGSMGKRNPQYDIDVVDDAGNSLPAGQIGEIIIRTHGKKVLGLFKEYYLDPVRTAEAVKDGIYHTGDEAYIDEDGYFWFIGRKDDIIKSSGYRIGPFEVENALMGHPAVQECAVTGVPDENRGQVVKATVVLKPEYKDKAGDRLSLELQKFVKKATAAYKAPRLIDFVDELPKTISGKIKHAELRAKNEQEQIKKGF
ncbi:MAG: AMP-binding protein [Bacteroidales bacterium]|nr:AMP-binding protein [Bacteroidales bacterium]